MKYYSTNKKVENVSLEEAVVKGLAEDKGLFMPNEIKTLPADFFFYLYTKRFIAMSFEVV